MPNLKNKEALKDLTEKFKSMKGMIMTEYHGLSVAQISDLRNQLRKSGCEYLVVKNTISKIALKEIGMESASEYFDGPTAIVVEGDDPVSPAKVLSEFAKKNEKLVIKAGILDGKVIALNEIKALASLPTKEVLIGKMLGSMNAPISNFVGVLSAVTRNFVCVLNAIKEQKEKAA